MYKSTSTGRESKLLLCTASIHFSFVYLWAVYYAFTSIKIMVRDNFTDYTFKLKYPAGILSYKNLENPERTS